MNLFIQLKSSTNLEFMNSGNIGFAFHTLNRWMVKLLFLGWVRAETSEDQSMGRAEGKKIHYDFRTLKTKQNIKACSVLEKLVRPLLKSRIYIH